ncbi:hypothetical protein, partial [Klebsiella pneumoniae]|uniref:hypothetical protein n=1 Tax=Klebsiella pneumoniae TaxID=573 RepID=UPI002730B753
AVCGAGADDHALMLAAAQDGHGLGQWAPGLSACPAIRPAPATVCRVVGDLESAASNNAPLSTRRRLP